MRGRSVPPTSERKGRTGGSNHSKQYTGLYCKPIDRQGGRHAVRSARVPLLHPCGFAREKLSVRERYRRSSPLAFCSKRRSVGRTHHYRKCMYSIRRFRTKLIFRRNMLHNMCTTTIAHTYVKIHTSKYTRSILWHSNVCAC